MAASRRHPARKRSRFSYREVDSEDSAEETSIEEEASEGDEAPPQKRRKSSRITASQDVPNGSPSSQRRRRHATQYQEPDTDDDFEAKDEQVAEPSATQRKVVAQNSSRDRKATRSKQVDRPRKPPIAAARTAPSSRPAQKAPVQRIESDGVVPPWATLPFEILLQTFIFASYPLIDENSRPAPSIAWLCNLSRTCRAFAEPAITALYHSPPLVALDKPHRLLELLAEHSEHRFFNYRTKVKGLDIDLMRTLAYTAPGRGVFQLKDLIPVLPNLEDIHIFDIRDHPLHRRLGHSIRWHYPDSIFESLIENGRHLKSWWWNRTFCFKTEAPEWIKHMHRSSPFQSLQSVKFTNFAPEKRSDDATSSEKVLADAVTSLPKLSQLAFESSAVVNGTLLQLLPSALQSITINNCGSLKSDEFQDFLGSHGSHLKNLVLDHNQSLEISFLCQLKQSCPRLETFKMDLNYYNSHATHNDSEPIYIDLLREDEIPTWPSTLRSIEMIHLRKWTHAAADNFFGSLINSASQLPDLRSLILKANINVGWRDRVAIREHWIGRLHRVFLRKSPPPSPHLVSLKAFRSWKQAQANGSIAAPPKRTLSHIEIQSSDPKTLPIRTSAESKAIEKQKKQTAGFDRKRLRTRGKDPAIETSTSDGDSNSDSRYATNDEEEKLFIQGMCDVVDVRIDNQRPREELFNENDFLDAEASDDEDWNGSDDMPGDTRYAW